ncbi:MAG: heterodisulfide reductase-related iron-sulfur binding cluster [Candidatus Korobacteraceae bacterium]
MNPAEATREIYWNISNVWVMYALFLPVVAIAAYGVYRHVALWRQGLPLARFDHPGERVRLLVKHVVAQSRTARDGYAGLFHRLIFYGFAVLVVATTIVALESDLGVHIMHGRFYLYFQSFIVDVFGALVMVGVGMAAARRFVARPKKLVYTDEAAWILVALFVIVGTGFLIEGWRIAATSDPWGPWSPFGNIVARLSRPWMSVAAMQSAHRATWWFHLVVSFAFLACIPYTKMMHLITAPLNIYTASLSPIGASLKVIDFDNTAAFGVNSLKGFTWKDLLDLDACTECGRCTAVCPANAVGKELSPRDLILGLRNLMHERPHEAFGLGSIASGAAPSAGADACTAATEEATLVGLPIIGAMPATSPNRLWQCTTCAACVGACPVFIEQMPKIVDMRRHLVMEEAEFPESMQEAITSLESRGHPFRGTQATRMDWTEGLKVGGINDVNDAEVLLWVGCGGALIERNQKITRATAQLLEKAGVKFAILGREEKCCGDPARRIGNEFLFATLAKENIATLHKHQVKKIVTACPHCFNTVKNEYPQFGGLFEVYHHSEYLARLVNEGRLNALSTSDKKVTFHDPCYLGRQNGVYDAPRQVAQSASRQGLQEMERSRSSSFCCGGGGGMSFVDELPGQRVNQERAREALDTGAGVVAVACPFCMTMLEDGVNARKGVRDVRVMDISELLLETLQPSGAVR